MASLFEDRRVRIGILAAAVIAAVVLIVLIARRPGKNDEAIAEGIAVLEQMENADVAEVDTILAAQRQARIDAEREKILSQLRSGEADVWSMFEDYAIMGDSRAVGFSFYGFLAEERVLAGAGWTIKNIYDEMEALVALNPKEIFLCFGLNDTSIGYWSEPDSYAVEYHEILDMIQERLPNAKIFVSSILPAKDPAFQRAEVWRDIPQWSERVRQELEGTNYTYVDNNDIAAEYTDLWDIDGIHVMYNFYPIWASNLIMAVYDESAQDTAAEGEADG